MSELWGMVSLVAFALVMAGIVVGLLAVLRRRKP